MLGVLAVLSSVALTVCAGGSHVAVNLPYLNPAGVEYVAPVAPALAEVNTYSHGITSYAAAPAAYLQHHQAYAALNTVHHVPAEAHVPVTSVQAHHGVISDFVDVAKPAVQTRRFEVRRPAIQKQFYDIEERVVIRPAGSALLELDEPLAKIQKGPAVVHDIAAPAVAAPGVAVAGDYRVPVAKAAIAAPALVASTRHVGIHAAPALAVTPGPALGIAHTPAVAISTGGFVHQQVAVGVAHAPTVAITPAPIVATPGPIIATPAPILSEQHGGFIGSTPAPPLAFDQSDSVVVENADLSRSLPLEHRQSAAHSDAGVRYRQEELNQQFLREAAALQLKGQQEVAHQQLLSRQHGVVASTVAPTFVSSTVSPIDVHAHAAPIPEAPLPLAHTPVAVAHAAAVPHPVVPSVKNPPEIAHHNQAKLIDLLTEKGGVADVGFGRAGHAGAPVGDAGLTRARVLSAARETGHPIGERVNTRRVVVSRPIETVQEFDVLEPATKIERVEVHQPTVFKSLRQDIARVPTSIPVQSKTLVPAAVPVAHAAVPVAHAPVHLAHAAVPVAHGLPLAHSAVTAVPSYDVYH